MMRTWITVGMMVLASAQAFAQGTGMKLDRNQPIEVVSDTLEVLQDQQKAIFSGNVVATQGNINMRAATMTVFYRNTGSSAAAPAVPATENTGMAGEGIYRIEADTNVLFASPLETAQGDKGIYDVDGSTISLLGNVLLTREGNVLKGTRMDYNLGTGRSVLAGGAPVSQGGTGRVRGLFIPKKAGEQGTQP